MMWTKKRTLLIGLRVVTVGTIGLVAFVLVQHNSHPKTIEDLQRKYKDKYTNWTEKDTQSCVDDYYRIYPDAKNPRPGVMAFAVPCPGVPQ